MSRLVEAKKWLRGRWLELLLSVALVGILAWYGVAAYSFRPEPTPTPMPAARQFDAAAAYQHVLSQMEMGPRPTGSEGSLRLGEYIIDELQRNGWHVETQDFVYQGVKARNIIARAGKGPVALIGAHYDTRRRADRDPDPAKQGRPVPGANDGASGVAILLELARSLEKDRLRHEVWLTFFDAEDNGRLDGWDFIEGSRYLAENLEVSPEMVVIVDMVGDASQQIYKEKNSTKALQDEIWRIAADLGLGEHFASEYKWAMVDDHTPFLEKGIASVDIIDFDYPYWHTTEDTADKVSAASLERVGRVLEALLEEGGNP